MAYYKDFSNYECNNQKIKNVVNIGWLGGEERFEKGDVSNDFLMSLWEYYKCPVYPTRKLYENKCLDGHWRFFTAISNERNVQLGSYEIRVIDKNNGVIYAAPNLIIHYIINHKYMPPKEFIDAVISSPKPNSDEYSNMIHNMYLYIEKYESANGVCPFCNSKYAIFAYREKKSCPKGSEVRVVDSNSVERDNNDRYNYYLLCENCGHLYEFDMNSIMQRYSY